MIIPTFFDINRVSIVSVKKPAQSLDYSLDNLGRLAQKRDQKGFWSTVLDPFSFFANFPLLFAREPEPSHLTPGARGTAGPPCIQYAGAQGSDRSPPAIRNLSRNRRGFFGLGQPQGQWPSATSMTQCPCSAPADPPPTRGARAADIQHVWREG